MYTAIYAYLDILCFGILAFILYHLDRNSYSSTLNRSFSSVIVSVMSIIALDATAILVSGTNYFVSVIINATFLSVTGLVGYSWLLYTQTVLGYTDLPRWIRILQAVPVLVLAFVCYASIGTGWIFWIDPVTVLYHRGPFHIVQVLLAASYLLIAAVLTIHAIRKDVSLQRRREHLTLLSFFVLPALGVSLDAFIYGIPFTWTLCTVAVLVVFVNFQEYSISTDPLTTLNNRRQFDSRAKMLIESHDEEHPVFLILMDIDHFKLINDTYGHRVGDMALIETASLLKKVVTDRRLLVARYGGDEFVIVGQLETPDEATRLVTEIEEAIRERNHLNGNLYPLALSIGWSKTSKDGAHTVGDLIAQADKGLYAQKAIHRSAVEG